MPRKGAFKRCVESVSRRSGVSDPRAVCAKSIAGKRGRTQGRVNPKRYTEDDLYSFTVDQLNKLAFGFTSGDAVLPISKLRVEYPDDLADAKRQARDYPGGKIEWARSVDLTQPIEVHYHNGKLMLSDGHHRYYAAKLLGRKTINAYLRIDDDPRPIILRRQRNGRVNPQTRLTAKERALIGAAKKLAAAKAAPVALLLNKGKKYEGEYAVYSSKSGMVAYGVSKARAVKMAKRFTVGTGTVATISGTKIAEYSKGRRINAGKRNPEAAAAERFEDFHGESPKEILEWEEPFHYHGVTSDIGELVSLVIRVPKIRGGGSVTVKGFKGARLTMNEAGTQLYTEGGDQSLDLASFGIKTQHDKEYLGELVEVTYHTTKKHLGRDGGTANYVHRFGKMESSGRKTEKPQMFYDVLNEEILFAGGGYEIPSEGIDG